MALRVSCRPVSEILLVLNSCKSAFRTRSLFSSYSRQPSGASVEIKVLSSSSNSDWPDTRLGVLEPANKRFPLPGLVGGANKNSSSRTGKKPQTGYDADVLTEELAHERQSSVLEQFAAVNEPNADENGNSQQFKGAEEFVFFATECPQLLLKDFLDLFPNQNAYTARNLTVLLMCRKRAEKRGKASEMQRDVLAAGSSVDDELRSSAARVLQTKESGSHKIVVSSSHNDVEASHGRQSVQHTQLDRDPAKSSSQAPSLMDEAQVFETFVEFASDLCQMLHSVGHWADFIDPTSGRPYIGDHLVGVSSYEVDDRYRRFGFEILSQGACKVLSHHVRGSKPYVGCLFTSAPPSHPLIKGLLEFTARV